MSAADTARLLATLGLDNTGFVRGVNSSLSAAGKLDKGIGRVGKGAGQLAGGLVKVGVVAAGAAVAGLTIAAKKAIAMDDAFAGVAKTVDASGPQLAALNGQLHALATRIPVNFTDLAGIAAEAGALGVARTDIIGFTDTVARLSAATQGLSTTDAAEAFGKFKNSLGLTEKQIEQSASALIALGNAGASSEGDIIEIGKRFAGAGRTAGLTAAQVLGLSSAIASVGVQPEAAGGSLSRLFNNINKYIGTGDKKLQAFAKTTGQTTKAFAKGFEKDALGSFEAFLKGISKLSGPEQAKRLKEAGVVNVRDISAIQLLAHSYGEVKRQTDLASDAFNKNTALTDVSNKRFDTLHNKLKVLGQNFSEAGYQISEGFLPAVGRAADKMTAFLQDPKNIATLRSIGDDIGKAIDKIDFGKLLSAAQGLAKAFDPALQILLKIVDVISSLPPEVVGAGGGLLVANKISGGAITAGLGNIIGGLGETLAKTLASRIPVFGKAFVQPVFVTNLGPGGLGGLGGGGAAGAAGGIAGDLAPMSLAALGGTILIGTVGSVIANEVEKGITDGLTGVIRATGLGNADLFSQQADRARMSSIPGLLGTLVTDPGSIINKETDAINQLTTFMNRPHPDFLGDLGNLLNATYHPDQTTAPTNAAPGGLGGAGSKFFGPKTSDRAFGEHARVVASTPAIDALSAKFAKVLDRLHNVNRSGRGDSKLADSLRAQGHELSGKLKTAEQAFKTGLATVGNKQDKTVSAEDRIHAAAEAGARQTSGAVAGTTSAVHMAASSIAAAIAAARPSITVAITASGVQKVTTTTSRYGTQNGSAGGGRGSPDGIHGP